MNTELYKNEILMILTNGTVKIVPDGRALHGYAIHACIVGANVRANYINEVVLPRMINGGQLFQLSKRPQPITETTANPQPQNVPFIDIPPEVYAAAETLHIFFEKNNIKEWELAHVADRRLVTKLERLLLELKNKTLQLRDSVKGLLTSLDPMIWNENCVADFTKEFPETKPD